MLSSPEIWALWGKKFLAAFPKSAQPTVLFLPAGERWKRLPQVEKLADQLARAGADRSSVLIAFGGGIVGDLGGFLAAIYMRGIDYIQVPTTLLAQVDSSVGGKTGVNLAAGKNLIGSFHHPRAVFADLDVLQTLPDREFRAGLFESVKAGIIRDAALFRFMEKNAEKILGRDPAALRRVIADSIRMKAGVVALDERESGLRMILNFGHTLGHAIEAATALQQAPARRSRRLGHARRPADRSCPRHRRLRPGRAHREDDPRLWTAAPFPHHRRAAAGRRGPRQEKPRRRPEVCPAPGNRRCGCGGRCEGEGTHKRSELGFVSRPQSINGGVIAGAQIFARQRSGCLNPNP